MLAVARATRSSCCTHATCPSPVLPSPGLPPHGSQPCEPPHRPLSPHSITPWQPLSRSPLTAPITVSSNSPHH
eukprot:293953-Chlamydomonas_euryale.AAC.1